MKKELLYTVLAAAILCVAGIEIENHQRKSWVQHLINDAQNQAAQDSGTELVLASDANRAEVNWTEKAVRLSVVRHDSTGDYQQCWYINEHHADFQTASKMHKGDHFQFHMSSEPAITPHVVAHPANEPGAYVLQDHKILPECWMRVERL